MSTMKKRYTPRLEDLPEMEVDQGKMTFRTKREEFALWYFKNTRDGRDKLVLASHNARRKTLQERYGLSRHAARRTQFGNTLRASGYRGRVYS